MDKMFSSAFEFKLIYIFEIKSESHKGLLKIGDTTIQTDDSIDNLPPNCRALNQAAIKRIRQYTNILDNTQILQAYLLICYILSLLLEPLKTKIENQQ